MGDWADMHSEYDYDFAPVRFSYAKDIKDSLWIQKNGERIKVGDMTDKHLLNAYKMFDDEKLFIEMVVRLFEKKLMEETND